MSEIIYQATDLTGSKRVEFLNEARRDRARLRATDGTSLVMLPERTLSLLEALAKWGGAYAKLSTLLRRSTGVPSTSELGELAWLRSLDQEDMEEFLTELQDAIVAAKADEDTAILDECVHAWKATARQLSDPLRRSVLMGTHHSDDYVPAESPDVMNGSEVGTGG
ncbi:hypothetical protein ACFQ08_10865 [Streptosporangium algeriense]|uniref:Tail assembly chaperone n=1 Tax=Streptosporangium algeriense TaxID=1682748 RepID=A0ABW3DMF6_9ACTN